jgi:alpha-1,2-mannosyltransferase
VILFLTLFAVFGLTARTSGGSWDYYSANYASWHVVHDGDPWLDGGTVPGLQGDPEESTWVMHDAPNGHTVVKRFPGAIAIALPAYWIAQAGEMTVVPGAITAALACAFGILMLFLAMRTIMRESVALAACGLLALGTPIWTVAADAVWPHTVTVLGIGGMAWGAVRQRWWLVGLFGGVLLWGRLHGALIVAIFGVLLGWWRRSPRITLVVGSVSGSFLALVCLWTRWWTGSWNPLASYGSDVLSNAQTGWARLASEAQLFVSPDRGILVWSPLMVLLTPALIRGWKDIPDWARALLFGGLAYTLLQAWISRAVGGDSFYGYRHGIELVMAATPAYAMTTRHLGSTARQWVAPLMTLQVFAMAFGALFDPFLTAEQVWHDNAFYYFALREAWPVGPLMLVGIMCFVMIGLRILERRKGERASMEKALASHS